MQLAFALFNLDKKVIRIIERHRERRNTKLDRKVKVM